MTQDIEYYREQAKFWHNRTSEVVNHNQELQKENRELKKSNTELKAMAEFVRLLKIMLQEKKA